MSEQSESLQRRVRASENPPCQSTTGCYSPVACAGLAGAASADEPKYGDFASETVKVADATREYRLVVPKTVDLSKPTPLVIAFHGMGTG